MTLVYIVQECQIWCLDSCDVTKLYDQIALLLPFQQVYQTKLPGVAVSDALP